MKSWSLINLLLVGIVFALFTVLVFVIRTELEESKGIYTKASENKQLSSIEKITTSPSAKPTVVEQIIPSNSITPSISTIASSPTVTSLPMTLQLSNFFHIKNRSINEVIVNREIFEKELQISPYIDWQKISGYEISADISYHGPRAMARVLLVDSTGKEHLVYEGFPLLNKENNFSIDKWCEETCFLNNIIPTSLKIELNNANIILKTIHYSQEEINISQIDYQKEFTEIRKKQNQYKIEQINNNMYKQQSKWFAGETNISKMSYAEKVKIFTGKVPNLQGLEFYKEGIFELEDEIMTTVPVDDNELPSYFSWRDFNGQNWITKAKHQQSCGSCWAYSASGVMESLINIHYNQLLNVDISEQDMLCRYPGSCSTGNFLYYTYDVLQNFGMVTEFCLDSTNLEVCDYSCTNPQQYSWKLRRYGEVKSDDYSIKKALMEKGPISFGVASLWHFMMAVGYENIDEDKVAWHIKNSWGEDWGNNGFIRLVVPKYDRYGLIYAEGPYYAGDKDKYEVNCEDKDRDNYCYWGVSTKKPDSCPAWCPDDKDLNDIDNEVF